MTVREAVRVLPNDEKIQIAYSGIAYDFQQENPFMLDAYGDYLINSIRAFYINDKIEYELDIAIRPAKAQEAV